MIKRFRQARKIFGIAMLAGTAIAFFSSGQYQVLKLAFNYWNPVAITDFRLRNLSTDEYISEIQSSIDQGDLAEAAEIAELAKEYGHQIPQELVEQTVEGYLQSGIRLSSDFGDGFFNGSMHSGAAITGSFAADLTLYGDLRDLKNEGYKFYSGEDPDKILLTLSAVGVATSLPAIAAWVGAGKTAGLGTPLALTATGVDNSVSVIKSAYKLRKVSDKLTASLSRISSDAINTNKLKQSLGSLSSIAKLPSSAQIMAAVRKIDLSEVAKGKTENVTKVFVELTPVDLKAASRITDGIVSKKAISEISDLASSNLNIMKAGGAKTSFKALEIADDAKDMSKISTIAGKYGNKSASILKVLGKKAYKLGKLLYLIGAVLIGVIGWLLYAAWLAFKTTNGTIRLIHRAGKRA